VSTICGSIERVVRLLLSHVYGLRVIPQLAAIRDNHRRHADFSFPISVAGVSRELLPNTTLSGDPKRSKFQRWLTLSYAREYARRRSGWCFDRRVVRKSEWTLVQST
jgi:hypothetical protein